MPGVVQHTQESLRKEVRGARRPRRPGRDPLRHPCGEGRDRLAGRRIPTASCRSRCATSATRSATTLVLMADDCLDEYTDHGHCGILTDAGRRRQRRHARALREHRGRAGRRGRRRHRAVRDDGRPGRRDPRRARRAGSRRHRRSSPTRRSTRPRSTARSATPPSARRSSATARGYQMDAAERPRGARPRSRSTSTRAPTW